MKFNHDCGDLFRIPTCLCQWWSLYDDRILGIKIYEPGLDGEKYSGASMGKHMGIFGGSCMAAVVIAEELIAHRKNGVQ